MEYSELPQHIRDAWDMLLEVARRGPDEEWLRTEVMRLAANTYREGQISSCVPRGTDR